MNQFIVTKPMLQLIIQFGIEIKPEDMAAFFAGILAIILLKRLIGKKK